MKSTVRYRTLIGVIFPCIMGLLFPFGSVAQNDACGSAPVLTSAPGCFNTAGSLPVAATYTAIPALGCGAANDDVWYTFIANSSNPTITLSSNTVSNVRLQIFSGSCGSLTSVACGTTSIAATGLTPSTSYFIRIYSTSNASGTFNICITDPHNLCGNAVTLTSGTSCTNIPGNMYGATLTATTINAPNCATGVTFDIWYRFVAQTTNPTITLSSIGVNFTNPGIQLLSNNCGGTFTSFYCGTTSIAADFLTPGTTYFIRVYSTSATGPVSPVGADFNICITDPVSPPPFNDECANAINLPIWNTCNNIGGNMAGATASSTPLGGLCTGPLAYDVWYKFNSINTTATITLSSFGTNFLASRGVEIFSGNCGSLTSIACGVNSATAAGLTAGSTYYVRVYSTTTPVPNGNARFNICATTTNAPVRFGNSYVNISKKTTGGVVESGDTLEIRMTVNHTSGTMYGLRYVDNIPTNTSMLTGTGDSIRVITNEGLTFRKYTLAASDDAATYLASPPVGQYNIRVNLGFGSSSTGTPVNNTETEFASATGQMVAGSDRPRGGGGMLFATAFRVVVTGSPGDTINLNAGKFIYQTSLGGSDITLTANPFKILISDPLTLCTNSIGVNNAAEFGGTFGSGSTLNRNTDLTAPIGGYTFISDVNAYIGVGDGRYAIVKNLSPRSGTVNTARRRNTCNVPAALAFDDNYNCNKRMFDGFWFIDGDHTGTNNATGNAPPAATTNSGYMLMVNADYVASEVYRQSITNLCPNTYYEFSAWVKNICPTCGIDSTGAQFTGTPTAPTSGYPGVYPNLSFSLNDVDYYSSGEIDTLGWLKKGFVFRTGPSQTTATFSIRNNSQGGGGNDWALDDIAVATCLPNMMYSPSNNPTICEDNTITIYDTISSYFDNYTFYKWQRSTDGGANWVDIAGATGIGTPVWNGSAYVYVTSYTIPPAFTTAGNDGDLYRVVVGTTLPNISDINCQFSDPVSITLNVLTDCGPVLTTDLLSVAGRLTNNRATITWVTSKEDQPVYYTIEKSETGRDFTQIAIVDGYNNPSADNNTYHYTDPATISGKVYYRVVVVSNQAAKKYSRIIPLATGYGGFSFESVLNPFLNELQYEVSSPVNGFMKVELIDAYGRIVRAETQQIYAGINSLNIYNTDKLSAGAYLMRASLNGKMIIRRLVKK